MVRAEQAASGFLPSQTSAKVLATGSHREKAAREENHGTRQRYKSHQEAHRVEMKALSLKQPWASLIAIGKKTIETRTWSTNYRGKLLIVSSKTFDKNYPYHNFLSLGLPMGKALAIVEVVDCRKMKKEDEEAAGLPYRPDLYSWILSDIQKIEPFPVKGQLRFYEVKLKGA